MNRYRKKATQAMEPWVEGMDMSRVSVGHLDIAAGSPKEGDMIAHTGDDIWLINKAFFDDNYEVEST
jgi:hypothetical protein